MNIKTNNPNAFVAVYGDIARKVLEAVQQGYAINAFGISPIDLSERKAFLDRLAFAKPAIFDFAHEAIEGLSPVLMPQAYQPDSICELPELIRGAIQFGFTSIIVNLGNEVWIDEVGNMVSPVDHDLQRTWLELAEIADRYRIPLIVLSEISVF